MSKAILVIDIDDYDIEELTVDYHLWREGFEECEMIHKGNSEKLKPMPKRKCDTRPIERKVRDLTFESGFRVDTLGVEIDEYAKGFNACIDELLGEREK